MEQAHPDSGVGKKYVRTPSLFLFDVSLQSCTIKEVLKGKDVLARARTGSGSPESHC